MTTRTATLGINVLEEELAEAADYCLTEHVGAEVTAFAYPANLEDDGFDARIRRHAETLDGVHPVFFHGPFLDLYATSPDARIAQVARERHERALGAAVALGARIYVAHLNSIPLIRNREYRSRFVAAAVSFWVPLADQAAQSGMTIVLENMWERGPELQKAVAAEANHPHLRTSFDNGHALVFSDRPAGEWIRVLGDDLAHLHLHDNDGTYDEHHPVGEGIEDWPALLQAWRGYAAGAALVLESDRLKSNQQSLAALRTTLEDAR